MHLQTSLDQHLNVAKREAQERYMEIRRKAYNNWQDDPKEKYNPRKHVDFSEEREDL